MVRSVTRKLAAAETLLITLLNRLIDRPLAREDGLSAYSWHIQRKFAGQNQSVFGALWLSIREKSNFFNTKTRIDIVFLRLDKPLFYRGSEDITGFTYRTSNPILPLTEYPSDREPSTKEEGTEVPHQDLNPFYSAAPKVLFVRVVYVAHLAI